MKLALATLSVTALLFTGCNSDPTPTKPTTAAPKMDMPVMTASMPEKDCSHTVTSDEPVFSTMPGAQGASPVGMIKAGTKVLVMVPMGTYSKCELGGGKTVYVKTASLKPTTN